MNIKSLIAPLSAVFFSGFSLTSCIVIQTQPQPQPEPQPGPGMTGGYGTITDWSDEDTSAALLMAKRAVNSEYGQSTELVSGRSQIVAGINYEFNLRSRDTGRIFEVVVYHPVGGRPMRVTSIR